MTRIFGVLLWLFLAPLAVAQTGDGLFNPVTLQATSEEENVRPGELFRVVITADLAKGWSIYSLHPSEDQEILKETRIFEDAKQAFISLTPWYETKLALKRLEALNLELAVHWETAKFYRNFKLPPDFSPQPFKTEFPFEYQACSDRICLPPVKKLVPLVLDVQSGPVRNSHLVLNKYIDELPHQGMALLGDLSRWGFLILAMSTGFLALLTPCVLPMIPLTLNHFILQSPKLFKQRLLLIASFLSAITLIYSLSGLLISGLWGAGAVLNLAANPVVNFASGILFLIFAASLYGIIRLRVSSSVINRLNKLTPHAEQKSKLLSALLIGITFTLTSFTCNLQLIGSLLVAAAYGSWLWPFIGMVVYSLAFGLPFAVLGFSPQAFSWLKFRGGQWQKHLQIFIATLELLVAIKFFANVDLALQLQWLSRDLVLGIYIIICLALVVYNGYLLWFNKVDLGVSKLLLIGFSVIYIAAAGFFQSGLGNHSLGGMLDAFLPPPPRTEYLVGRDYIKDDSAKLQWETDYHDAAKIAQQRNMPMFVDFTGYTCLNCRWMEQNIFRREKVHFQLKDNFVLVRLYTDGGADQHKNQALQIKHFKTVALPFYAIVDSTGSIKATSAGIVNDPADFVAFLESGTDN